MSQGSCGALGEDDEDEDEDEEIESRVDDLAGDELKELERSFLRDLETTAGERDRDRD